MKRATMAEMQNARHNRAEYFRLKAAGMLPPWYLKEAEQDDIVDDGDDVSDEPAGVLNTADLQAIRQIVAEALTVVNDGSPKLRAKAVDPHGRYGPNATAAFQKNLDKMNDSEVRDLHFKVVLQQKISATMPKLASLSLSQRLSYNKAFGYDCITGMRRIAEKMNQ